jgi:hypothetical protein
MRFQTAREFSEAILKAYEKRAQGDDDTVLGTRNLAPSGKTDTTFPPAGWRSEDLKPLEELLTQYVGPMARIVVKKAAARTVDPQQLLQALAENLAADADRNEFLTAAMARLPSMTHPGTGSDPGTRTQVTSRFGKSVLDPDQVDRAAQRLAPYVGPIAKVLARKAAVGAASRTALYLALAENISDADDKAKFLKESGIR